MSGGKKRTVKVERKGKEATASQGRVIVRVMRAIMPTEKRRATTTFRRPNSNGQVWRANKE